MRLRLLLPLLIWLCTGSLRAQMDKCSPYLRRAALEAKACYRPIKGVHGEKHAVCFVRTTRGDILKDAGCSVLASWGDIHIASIPLSQLRTLAAKPEVMRIEANPSGMLCNDTTAHITGVSTSPWISSTKRDLRNTYGLTGKGVMVGVMDVGFDLRNPNFRTRDDQECRIRAIWDMLDYSEAGSPVTFQQTGITDDQEAPYLAPGRQYTDAGEIWAKRCTADSLLATHGTHTLGTAAGSGLGGDFRVPLATPWQYSGMAPEADICLVANLVGTNRELVPEDRRMEYTTATDMLGFYYIFQQAELAGKPCVINFSEGAHEDLYENQLYQEVLKQMVGPGRILCASAGNEGQHETYMHKPAGTESCGAFLTSTTSQAYYTLRSTHPTDLLLTLYPAEGERVTWRYDSQQLSLDPDSVMTDTILVGNDRVVALMAVYPTCFDQSLYATEFLLINLDRETFVDASLSISLQLLGKDNDIEAFASGGYFTRNPLDTSLRAATQDHNIMFPGAAESVICVGSTAYCGPRENVYGLKAGVHFGLDGVVPEYSSRGPTMAGMTKPDVVAPGVNLVSSGNSIYHRERPMNQQTWTLNQSQYQGETYPWEMNSGTSMSAPVVTGIIALWLQRFPTLSPEDIMDALAHTCTQPRGIDIPYPNNICGWGQIDAVAGLEYLMRTQTGIAQPERTGQPHEAILYDLMGRRIQDTSTHRGVVIMSTPNGYVKVLR